MECCHGLDQDIQGGRVGPKDIQDVRRYLREENVCLFPSAPDPFVSLLLFAKKGGSPRLFSFLDRFSERVSSELRVDGSGYVIPCAINSSYHTEDITPSLICILCDEDGFQDFFVQECGRADF